MEKTSGSYDADLAQCREEYKRGRLDRKDLCFNPFAQAKRWLQEAKESLIPDPFAMILATATLSGRPSSRTVILKGCSSEGLVFYSNRQSRKAKELAENPWASVTFYWRELERQMHAEGYVIELSFEESSCYFAKRPRESQIAAWASRQGTPLVNRTQLEKEWESIKKHYEGRSIPAPPDWIGYRLSPLRFEFWQGGLHRLHDRFEYRKEQEKWELQRLSP